MDLQTIIALISSVGFPIVIVIAVGLGVWQAAAWLAAKVILPITNRAVAFFDALESSLTENTFTLRTLRAAQEEQIRAMQAAACRYQPPPCNPPGLKR